MKFPRSSKRRIVLVFLNGARIDFEALEDLTFFACVTDFNTDLCHKLKLMHQKNHTSIYAQ